MSRTRRKKPHWLDTCKSRDEKSGPSSNLTIKQRYETGNADLSDHEWSEDLEYRRRKKQKDEDKQVREELENWKDFPAP
jgi:hypothetical protein